ncbi:MAG TPA: PorT family protein [Bacteroidetes bacterium]|nr:PorT family protein [Bacteroidota bacterium]
MKHIFLLLFPFIAFSLAAQDISFGFRAGLNFNRIDGDVESDGGKEVEQYTGNTGFHVGASFTWKVTELMGLRAELIYNQKGARRQFDGPSYLDLKTTNGSVLSSTGTRQQNLNLTTSYIDIPVMGYFKPIEQVEIFAGAHLGFLVAANAFGELKYSNGRTSTGSAFEDFRYEIDGNYLSDKPGEAIFDNPPKTITIGGGATAEIPGSAGVYYEFSKDMGKLYKVIDVGAVGGIAVFLSGSLYISGRANWGLMDITKTGADVSLIRKDGDAFLLRNDKDRNFSIQTSVGFEF